MAGFVEIRLFDFDLIKALGCKVRSFFIGKSSKEKLKALNFAQLSKILGEKFFIPQEVRIFISVNETKHLKIDKQ